MGPVLADVPERGKSGIQGGNCTEVQAARKTSEAVMANLAGRWQADALSRMVCDDKKGMAVILGTGVLTMGRA